MPPIKRTILVIAVVTLVVFAATAAIYFAITLTNGGPLTNSASSGSLVDLPPPRIRPADVGTADPRSNGPSGLKPFADRVALAVVPGAAKLPGTASATSGKGPAAPRLPQLVQLGGPRNTAAPQSVAIHHGQLNLLETTPFRGGPAAVNSSPPTSMDIALHPSLKYSGHVAAAYDVPLAGIGKNATAWANAINASTRPDVAQSVATEDDSTLVRRNLQMESARRFVTSMCEDHQGRLWVASDNGLAKKPEGCVECFDPSAPELHQWTEYTTEEGLGDDTATAIACDHQGRVWVGHTANHGVSVFNGQKWHNYCNAAIPTGTGCLLGPLGERITHITVSPTNGDVWIATDCGLTRYIISQDDWALYGLPAGDPTSIAFDKQGNLYVATEHDGIAMANAADSYSVWRTATAPEQILGFPAGTGLPSDSVNDILVAGDGSVYAATDGGLAWSKNSGKTWQFIRGVDGDATARRGGQNGSGPSYTSVASAPAAEPAELAENLCTCLQETGAGRIYIGHPRAGLDVLDPAQNGRVTSASDPVLCKAIVIQGHTYIGSFSYRADEIAYPGPGGVVALGTADDPPAVANSARSTAVADLPAGAPPPVLKQLPPTIGLRNLRDLYYAGSIGEVLKVCGEVEDSKLYSTCQPQILYIRWMVAKRLRDPAQSDRLRDLFLRRYPKQVLAADMYLDIAMWQFARGDYRAADEKLAMIQDQFPTSSASAKARRMQERLKLPSAGASG